VTPRRLHVVNGVLAVGRSTMVFTGARHGSAGGGIRYFAGAMVVVLLAGLFRLSRAVGRRVDALEAAAALGEDGRG
jgi:hypothetical protein